MESKFFTSSAKVGSTKRGFSDEVQESPTEKRAKRAKRSKKRRSKGEKDWVSFDQNSTPFSPVARKQTPTKPPTPFPLKKAHSAYVQRSADKTKETLGSENERDAKESLKQGTAQQSLKTETNTRKKVRGEPGVNNAAHDPIEDASSRIPTTTDGSPKEHVPKKHRKRPNRQERPYVPAVAGPSKPKVANKLAPADRELTPLSDITTPVDYTFKAFPNPPAIQFSLLAKSNGSKQASNEPQTSSIPEAALAAPAGTKTLKTIKKHLKALEETIQCLSSQLTTTTTTTTTTVDALRTDMAQLHERLDRNELRASIRHAILFNALVKVSSDLGVLNGRVDDHHHQQQQQYDEHVNHNNTMSPNGVVDGGGDNLAIPTTPGRNRNIDGKDKDKDKEPQSALRGKETKDRDRDRLDSLRSNRVKSMRQARKTLEQCLRTYTEDLNRAGSVEEVARHGGLCVQYAGDLFKTLG